jgi:hypothetical protein
MPRAPLLSRAGTPRCTVCTGPIGIGKVAWDSNEFPFHFSFGLNLSLNLKKSYPSAHSSKNDEISSVGFVFLRSIHEQY